MQVNYIRIDGVRPKSPADANRDIRPGARLWGVDDLPLTGMSPEDVREYLSRTEEAEFTLEPTRY
jgi:C-terminal processing protease CtpA/Prc